MLQFSRDRTYFLLSSKELSNFKYNKKDEKSYREILMFAVDSLSMGEISPKNKN
jgi:hypothetical protein